MSGCLRHAPLRHSHHAQSQSNGHTDGQALWDGGDSKGHPDIEHVQQLLALANVKNNGCTDAR